MFRNKVVAVVTFVQATRQFCSVFVTPEVSIETTILTAFWTVFMPMKYGYVHGVFLVSSLARIIKLSRATIAVLMVTMPFD